MTSDNKNYAMWEVHVTRVLRRLWKSRSSKRVRALFALSTLTMVEINEDFFETKDFQKKLET